MVYLIISLAIAIFMTFAFSILFAPLVTFFISFVVAFILLAGIHKLTSDEKIFQFKSKKDIPKKDIPKKEIPRGLPVTIVIGVILLLFVTVGILLLVTPMLMYKIIHFGWIIGLFILCPAILAALTYDMQAKQKMHTAIAICYYIVCIALIPLMIVGVSNSQSATYEIYTADDMRVLGNAPIDYDTVFILQNDIDFTDEDVSGWFGRRKEFDGIFEGNGYTLSNIVLSAEDKTLKYGGVGSSKPFGLGFVRTNIGIIRNLNFENCQFTLIIKSKYRDAWSDTICFGIISAINYGGKISDCNIINCQARYISYVTIEPEMSLDVGLNAETSYYGGADSIEPLKNVNIINDLPLDESFYTEDDREWKPIGIEEEKEKN